MAETVTGSWRTVIYDGVKYAAVADLVEWLIKLRNTAPSAAHREALQVVLDAIAAADAGEPIRGR